MVCHPTGNITFACFWQESWSILSQLQVRVNKTLMDNFFSKITQLQNQHEGSSLVKSGTTRRLFREYTAFLCFWTLETETFLPDWSGRGWRRTPKLFMLPLRCSNGSTKVRPPQIPQESLIHLSWQTQLRLSDYFRTDMFRVIDSHWLLCQRFCDPRLQCQESYRDMARFTCQSQRSPCSH